jgi:hypothetical protein
MPPQPPPKGPKRSAPVPRPISNPAPAPSRVAPLPTPAGDVSLGVAVAADSGTVTARKAGGLRDLALDVDRKRVGLAAALQHLAKAVNVAFQTDYGENYLEAVYQAAIVRRGEIRIVHREYFGFGESWFGQFGKLLTSLRLTLEGPDPASPEGRQRIAEKGPSTIRGLLSVVARKLDLVAEYEDRVPAYVEQMFDRLEASGIIVGWSRDDWEIGTTTIGLDVWISPRPKADQTLPGSG